MAETKVISTSALMEKFQYALDNKWGYIWGAAGAVWTAEDQARATREQTVKYGKRWIGHHVADCSGLFSWAFRQLGGYMYHGSNTMFLQYTTSKGTLKSGERTDGQKLIPGTAVFVWKESEKKYSHVGLYIGNGWVIEAASTQQGIIKSKASNKKWTHWGELKGVDYNDEPIPVPAGKAVVTGVRVALREGPSTSTRVMTRIETGTIVDIAKVEGWTYVKYRDKCGFMMNDFIDVHETNVTVTGKNVAVRAGTGTDTRVLARIPTGHTVEKETLPSDWEYISYGNRKGFMMKEFIREG